MQEEISDVASRIEPVIIKLFSFDVSDDNTRDQISNVIYERLYSHSTNVRYKKIGD